MLRCRLMFPLIALSFGLLSVPAPTIAEVQTSGSQVGFHWERNDAEGVADLLYGKQPVLRYMYAYDTSTPERTHDTYKVYHHVFGPGTDTIITKGPGGKYTHHRGLYVGWNITRFEGGPLDFWHCTKGAHQRHAKFLALEGNDKSGLFKVEIHWNDAQGKPVIVETRTLKVTKIDSAGEPGYGWQIDWSTNLQSERGPIQLDGDRQHAGFQFRAAQDVAEKDSARFLRPADFPQQPDAIQVGDKGDPPAHINLNWFAMTYPLDGRQYTVEYFEDPSLPKPSLYSERPYGRFGAFFKASLDKDAPLAMRYRVIVTAGETPTVSAIQQRYDAFVAGLKSNRP